MKYLVLLLMPFIAYSATKQELESRLSALSPKGDIRLHMKECGYDVPNMKLFVGKILDELDEQKVACLESVDAQVDAFIESQNQADIEKKSCASFIKGLNTSALNPQDRDKAIICLIRLRQ